MTSKPEKGYICSQCAKKRKWRWPKGHVATMHFGLCPDCGRRRGLSCHNDWVDAHGRRQGDGELD